MSAAERWRDALAAWAIPDDILAAAPAAPWTFEPALFARRADQVLDEPETASQRRAREVLPAGGSVLDVGCGGGAGSLPLVPPATLLTGVDDADGMLEAYASAADRRGVAHREIPGTWPHVAREVDAADVVVCHNVLYNIGDLVPFVAALTDHARRRVVVEIGTTHPLSNLNPLWEALHGLKRPDAPTSDDALAVLEELGLDVGHEEFERPWTMWGPDRSATVAMTRRRLCVGPERDAEIEAQLDKIAAYTPVRRSVALWWDGTAA
ncbi:MAG TPA: class I SAM-dependent methyltransferase [Acidimicrobiales bacterium]|nr:class I SAM-dependent methyltransferase [Acidimicrobiales bacterium]